MAQTDPVADTEATETDEPRRAVRIDEEPEALASVREDLQAFLQRRG
jgi:hypothetical protein